MKEIPLTRGQKAIVDDTDYESLAPYRWSAAKPATIWYAVRYVGRAMIYMHREITGAPKGLVVDHIDGDGLNNQRSNLRVCTQAENSRNRTRLDRRNKTGFRGVAKAKRPLSKPYEAYVRANNAVVHLGRFSSAEEAAKAYDAAARKHYGAYARLNFPEQEAA